MTGPFSIFTPEACIESEAESDVSSPYEAIEGLKVKLMEEKVRKAEAEAKAANAVADKASADARTACQEARSAGVRVWGEWLKIAGIVAGVFLGGYAITTRAPKEDMEKASEKTRAAIGNLSGEIQQQHESTERVKDYAERSVKAVSSAVNKNNEPDVPGAESEDKPRYGCIESRKGTLVCSKVVPVAAKLPVKANLPPAPELPPPAAVAF